MASQPLKLFALMTAFIVTLVACGGGGTQVAGGGIGGTGVSQGPITGFGSIFVNGVEFDTNNATIIKDGTAIGPFTTDDLKKYLKVGMIVTVDGNFTNNTRGTAATVTYAKELQGPIAAKTSDTLTVLGQTVIVDNLTKIEIAGGMVGSLADLAIGDVIEVSGFSTATGIRSSYIETKQAGSKAEYELKGIINTISGTLITIGAQTVNINGAAYNFTPKVGDYVEITGTIPSAGSEFLATSMELKSRTLKTTNAEKAELQGYVTIVTSTSEFLLNAQTVQINSQTKFSGGTNADIKPGLILEVEGSLVNGILMATKISFEDDLELEGNIATIDTTSQTLTLDSYPTIGISFNDTLTELEGTSSFSSIGVGDHVNIRGRMLDTASCGLSQCVLATQLTLGLTSVGGSVPSGGSSGGSSDNTELQGPIESFIPGQSITVLGVTVDTTSISNFSGEDITDSASFYNKVEIGDLVDISGSQTGGTIIWQSIALEN